LTVPNFSAQFHVSLDITIIPKNDYRFNAAAMLFDILPEKSAYFPNIYYHALFPDRSLSGASVSPTLQVRTSAILLFTI
jgi:hypothetical protein